MLKPFYNKKKNIDNRLLPSATVADAGKLVGVTEDGKFGLVEGGGGGGMNIIEPIKTGEQGPGLLSAAYFDCGEVILVDNIPYISAENANALFTWLKDLSMKTVFTFDFPDVDLFAGQHYNVWLSYKEDIPTRTDPFNATDSTFIAGLFPTVSRFDSIGFHFVGFTGDTHIYFGIGVTYK